MDGSTFSSDVFFFFFLISTENPVCSFTRVDSTFLDDCWIDELQLVAIGQHGVVRFIITYGLGVAGFVAGHTKGIHLVRSLPLFTLAAR